ncbi:MAG: succinate dehydrogenase, cytochrome b556 subunit [Acidimicrobiales bacterium]
MNLPDTLFLTALSLLIVLIALFSVAVFISGVRRMGGLAGQPGIRHVLRALELERDSEVSGTRWAFYLHRLTGVGVLGFLLLHIVDVSLFAFSHRLYNHVHQIYSTPELRVLECGLIFAVLFHTLNGLRLIAVDGFALSARISRVSLWPVLGVTVLAGVSASVIIMAPVF